MRTANDHQVLCPDGARLQVQTAGSSEGSVLVLLQGQANSHDWWAGLRRRYEKRFRTITMDYRGTGTTRSPAGGLTTGLLAEDVVCVLDALNVDQAHVYGASMGGRVAQMLAGRHPTRVLSLALACTSPGGRHAIEPNNDVRQALADSDPSARSAAMVDLFYTPGWGTDPTQSHLFGDPTMTAADRRPPTAPQYERPPRRLGLALKDSVPDRGSPRQAGPAHPKRQRRGHRRCHSRGAVAPPPHRTPRILRRVRGRLGRHA